jgi:CheY-like chemotaxis protein
VVAVSSRPPGSKIVVVESHRRLAPGVSAVIGPGRQEVVEARDAAAALVALGRGDVAMLIVDDELAGGDPYELCKFARTADGTPAIVLLASTYLAATRVRAARCGVDELIPKPAAISEVLTRIWLALRRRELETGAGSSALPVPVAEVPDLSLALLDAVELMVAAGRTGRVAVASGGRRRGWVAVEDGLVVDAQAGPLRGAPALGRLFRWKLTRAEQLIEPIRDRVMAVTPHDMCTALFQVRTAWPRLTRTLPLEQVLAANFGAMGGPAPALSPRMQQVLRLFDGRRRVIDVLDDADIPDPETCRFVTELITSGLLIPCEPPPEVNSHWDAPNASPDVFLSQPAEAETPVGWAATPTPPLPPPRPNVLTSESEPNDERGLVAGELFDGRADRSRQPGTDRNIDSTIDRALGRAERAGVTVGPTVEVAAGLVVRRRPELSDTGTKLGWAAAAAGAAPFSNPTSPYVGVASETGMALRSTMPAKPSIVIADPRGLGIAEGAGAAVIFPSQTSGTTSLNQPPDQPHAPPTSESRPRLRALPRPQDAADANEPTDPMIRIRARAGDPPPSVRSHSDDWPVETPPRRRALALAGVGALLGVAGSLLVCIRVGGPIRPEAPGRLSTAPAPAAAASTPAAAPPVATPEPAASTDIVPAVASAPAAAPASAAVPDPRAGAAAAAAAPPTLEDCRRAYARDKYSRIVRVCSQALEADAGQAPAEGRADAMAKLAHAELDRGNYNRARGWARKALALDPRLPEAYAYLGFVEDQAGRRDQALSAYRSYLELAPQGRYADDIRAIIDAGP